MGFPPEPYAVTREVSFFEALRISNVISWPKNFIGYLFYRQPNFCHTNSFLFFKILSICSVVLELETVIIQAAHDFQQTHFLLTGSETIAVRMIPVQMLPALQIPKYLKYDSILIDSQYTSMFSFVKEQGSLILARFGFL